MLPGEEGYSHEKEEKERKTPFGWAITVAKYIAATALGLVAGVFMMKLLNNHMEYGADKFSAKTMESGQPLARALQKFQDAFRQRAQAMEDSGMLPKGSDASHTFARFMAWITHPPIQKRIDRLNSL